MQRQSTSTVLMVRPDHFGFNPQTAVTNPFQHTMKEIHKSSDEVRHAAQKEFDAMVLKLEYAGVRVFVLPSRVDVLTPDAVFPNNWFSTHEDGRVVLYPLLTPNRRLERQTVTLLGILQKVGITNPEIIDLTVDEEKGLILESTGSLILDRVNEFAFAMASPRTIKEEFEKWCEIMGYEGVFITTPKSHMKEVYHTNINMSVGSEFAVVCLEVIASEMERKALQEKLVSLEKDCIEISLEQVYQFCGNILEIQSQDGRKLLAMSETARKAFTKNQLKRLENSCEILSFDIPVIEEVGGGGVRCMLAEIFTPI